MTPSGIEPAALRLVAQCLNQKSHRVPRPIILRWLNCVIETIQVNKDMLVSPSLKNALHFKRSTIIN